MSPLKPILVLSLLFGSAAVAEQASPLAQAKGCTECHDVTQKKMAPSFHSIASRHKGQADAAAELFDFLKMGSDDHEKVAATDAELKQLVAEILATP
jgi:cytochrome c551/c552